MNLKILKVILNNKKHIETNNLIRLIISSESLNLLNSMLRIKLKFMIEIIKGNKWIDYIIAKLFL